MKYLQEYKLFESNDDKISELKDLFINLEDVGFIIHVSLVGSNVVPLGNRSIQKYIYLVGISRKTLFNCSDIKDDLDFAIAYAKKHLNMDLVYAYCKKYRGTNRGSYTKEYFKHNIEDVFINTEIYNLSLHFKII